MRLTSMVTYQLDVLTIAAIAAATLDAWTTYYFIAHNLGVETNAVLAPLARHSLIWIPTYLLAKPLLIPAMPDVSRQAFAIGFLASGLLFGVNNLCGIYAGKYILVDHFGFPAIAVACFLLGILAFLYQLIIKNAGRSSNLRFLAIALLWLGVLAGVDAAFYLAVTFLQ